MAGLARLIARRMKRRFSGDFGRSGVTGPAFKLARNVVASGAGQIEFCLVLFMWKFHGQETTVMQNNDSISGAR